MLSRKVLAVCRATSLLLLLVITVKPCSLRREHYVAVQNRRSGTAVPLQKSRSAESELAPPIGIGGRDVDCCACRRVAGETAEFDPPQRSTAIHANADRASVRVGES